MNQNNTGPTFDGKFVITLVLVFGLWVGWQSYLAKKYPDAYKPQTQSKAVADDPVSQPKQDATPAGKANAQDVTQIINDTASVQEKRVQFKDSNWSFEISSKGMALKNIQLNNYTDRKKKEITFSSVEPTSLFATGLVGRREPLNFDIKQTSDNEYVGRATSEGIEVVKILQIKSEIYAIDTKVRVESITDAFVGLVTTFSEKIEENKGGFFLMPSFEHQEFYVAHGGSDSRSLVDVKTALNETHEKASVVGFGSQYFAAALVDSSPILAEFKANTLPGEVPLATGTLTHLLLSKSDSFVLNYMTYAGPKSYEALKAVNPSLTGLINLGFFRWLAEGILKLMKKLYAIFGNWGVAIIFLTIIVRIIVLPLNVIGYRQMKAMSKIQPEMKTLREKYKNDQQKLNAEMMRLLKEAKANPLGGCLPMFVQIPVFFALYQVIGQSIELYQAPFVFWIQDLSVKDPFYVLPILMGITMYFQQKITPTTLEPAQQKIMNFLPILFTLLMVTLPSGLTLYIFISTAFGVIQQIYFMKEKVNEEEKKVVLAKS